MNRASGIVAAVLAVVYVVFWIWYGGNGDPLSPSEVDELTERIAAGARSRGAEPDSHLIDAFRTLAEQDDGREFYMVNLMRYREKALYPEGSGYDDDVEAAAARYNAAVVPALIRRGSIPILVGDWQGTFLQPEDADVWDQLGIVRYRSRRDMLEMAASLSRENGGMHKWASIEKTHVFPVEPFFDFVFVRSAVAVMLIALGAAVHAALRFASSRRTAPDD
ncbi:MAG: hypothetical protein V3V67_04535 [Myxococcota bacterium]